MLLKMKILALGIIVSVMHVLPGCGNNCTPIAQGGTGQCCSPMTGCSVEL